MFVSLSKDIDLEDESAWMEFLEVDEDAANPVHEKRAKTRLKRETAKRKFETNAKGTRYCRAAGKSLPASDFDFKSPSISRKYKYVLDRLSAIAKAQGLAESERDMLN